MSRFELRWTVRHPLRWARHFWLHLALAALLATLSAAWGAEIFDQVTFAPVWPLLLAWVSGLVVATSLAPFSRWLNATCGAALMTIGTLRAMVLAEVFLVGTATRAVVVALLVKDALLVVLGVIWPQWTKLCGANATVEAGVDDRGASGA